MSSQRGSKPSEAGPGGARRPIPLPPESLRPPPRRERSPRTDHPTLSASPVRARRMGASRGFLIGLSVPVVGFLVAVLYLGWGSSLFQSGQPEARTEPEMQVRALIDRADPREEDAVAETGIPAEASEENVSEGVGEVLAIQLASFRTRKKAEQVLADARERTGLPGVILPATVDGVRWQRILLGAFSGAPAARAAARPLLEDGTIQQLVIRPVPSNWVPALTGKDSK